MEDPFWGFWVVAVVLLRAVAYIEVGAAPFSKPHPDGRERDRRFWRACAPRNPLTRLRPGAYALCFAGRRFYWHLTNCTPLRPKCQTAPPAVGGDPGASIPGSARYTAKSGEETAGGRSVRRQPRAFPRVFQPIMPRLAVRAREACHIYYSRQR